MGGPSSSSSSSSSGSYSFSSCSSSFSSSSSSFSSSSSSWSSSSSSSFSSSSSYSGPYWVRTDALGSGFGNDDTAADALTTEQFRAFEAGPGSIFLIKGYMDDHSPQHILEDSFDWSAKAGTIAEPIIIRGVQNSESDNTKENYRPTVMANRSSSSSSSSSFSSSSFSSSSSSFSSSSSSA